MSGASPERRIVPVILCGGAGTRLWPLSRLDRPKPLVALGGEETMLQLTAARVADRSAFAPPVVVAGAEDAAEIEAQLASASCPPALLIEEPCARSTAPAIALAALCAPEDALLLVMPSDHQVADAAAFRAAVAAAASAARQSWLVTFGIVPSRPETGYGYIAQGEALEEGVFRAARFAEKPDAQTARGWIAEGGWLWNAGIFLFRADAYLAALEALAPEILTGARRAIAGANRSGTRLRPDAESFAAAPARSIDRAVMEHSPRVAVVPVEMGWSDIGSWDALHALGPHDADGNSVTGDGVAVGSRGCLIRTDGLAVVALGVEDLVVVATDRAVLVMPRKDSQRVKEAIDALVARGHKAPPDSPEVQPDHGQDEDARRKRA